MIYTFFAEKCVFASRLCPYLFLKKNLKVLESSISMKTDSTKYSGAKTHQERRFPFKSYYTLPVQIAVAVFGLGFIDAGYSGDWSRIGIISTESENLLKDAAFLVIPLCLSLIISLSKQSKP